MKQGADYIGVSVGALIFNKKGEILLCKRSQLAKNEKGKWEAPGGAVKFWERREDAIKREIKEELGVDVIITDFLHVVDEMLPKDKQHWVGSTYIARIKGKQNPRIIEPRKCTAIGWFSLDKLPKPLSYVSTIDIEGYKKRLRR